MLEKISTVAFAFEIVVAFIVAPAKLRALWAFDGTKAFYILTFILCNMLAFADFQDPDLRHTRSK